MLKTAVAAATAPARHATATVAVSGVRASARHACRISVPSEAVTSTLPRAARREPPVERRLLFLARVDAVVDALEGLLQRAAGGRQRMQREERANVVARDGRAESREAGGEVDVAAR